VLGKNLLDENVLLSLGMDKVGEHEFHTGNIVLSGSAPIFTNAAKIAGAFTISGFLKYDTNHTGIRAQVNYTDGTEQHFYASNPTNGTYCRYVATTNSQKTIDFISLTYGVDKYNSTLKDFQIELGATATEFKPYKEQTLTVATPTGLNGIGDVRDYIDFEKGVYVKRIGERVFTGNEYWTSYGANQKYFSYATTMEDVPYITALNILSTHYAGIANYEISFYGTQQGIYAGYTNAGTSRCVFTTTQETVSAFTAWLKEQYSAGTPIKAKYVLAEPIETPLTAEQLSAFKALHSNKPITSITNDGGAEMSVAYVADTKLYIDNKFNELATAILNNA
jgi:hypothetical protein